VTGSEPQLDLELGNEMERLIVAVWVRLTQEIPTDVGRTSAAVLRTLRESGPQRITTLATMEFVAQPTMSALVQRLERRGLVSRARDPADARANLVQITPAGEDVLRARTHARAVWLAERLSELSLEDRERVLASLQLLVPTIVEPPTEG
jgi:DNA-binding MarR family transcriptional regulator